MAAIQRFVRATARDAQVTVAKIQASNRLLAHVVENNKASTIKPFVTMRQSHLAEEAECKPRFESLLGNQP